VADRGWQATDNVLIIADCCLLFAVCWLSLRLLLCDADVILTARMNSIGNSAGLWIGFSLFILFMLSLDLGLFNRKAHAIRYREATIWSAVWITLAMIFAAIVIWYQGTDLG
jgi:hypothetical protein